MSSGIQCFDTSGQLRFQATDYLARQIGRIEVKGAAGDGVVTGLDLSDGTPWAIFFSSGRGSNSVRCVVTASSSAVSWTFRGTYANTGKNPDGFIVFGVK